MKKLLFLLLMLCIGIAAKAQSTIINSTGALLEFNPGDTGYVLTNQDNSLSLSNGSLRLRNFNNHGTNTVNFKRLLLNNPIDIRDHNYLNIRVNANNISAFSGITLNMRILFRNGSTIDSSILFGIGLSQFYYNFNGDFISNYSLEHISNRGNIIGISIISGGFASFHNRVTERFIEYIQFGEPSVEKLPVQSMFSYFNDFNSFPSNGVSATNIGTSIVDFNGAFRIRVPNNTHSPEAHISKSILLKNPVDIIDAPVVRFKIRANCNIRLSTFFYLSSHVSQTFLTRSIDSSSSWTWVRYVGDNIGPSRFISLSLGFATANNQNSVVEIDSLYIEGFHSVPPTFSLFSNNDNRILTQGRVKQMPNGGYLANNALVSHSIRTNAQRVKFKVKSVPANLWTRFGGSNPVFQIAIDGSNRSIVTLNPNDTVINVITDRSNDFKTISITRLSSTGSLPHLFEGVYTIVNSNINSITNIPERKILFIGDHSVEGDQFNFSNIGNGHLNIQTPNSTYPALVANRLQAQLNLVSNNFATLHNLPNNQFTNLNKMLSVNLPNIDTDTAAWPVDFSSIHTVVIDLNRRDFSFAPVTAQGNGLNFRRRVKEAFHIARAAYPLVQLIITPGMEDPSLNTPNLTQAFRDGYQDYLNETNDSRAHLFVFVSQNHHGVQSHFQFSHSLTTFIQNLDRGTGGSGWHFNRNRRIEVLRRGIVLSNTTNAGINEVHSYQVVGHNNNTNIMLSTHSEIGLSTTPNGPFFNTLTLQSLGGMVYVRSNVAQLSTHIRMEITHEANGEIARLPIFFSNVTESAQAISNKLQFYPNPSNGKVFINKDGSLGDISGIQVINSVGQMVHQENPSSEFKELDLSYLAKGVYTVQLQINGTLVRKQLVLN